MLTKIQTGLRNYCKEFFRVMQTDEIEDLYKIVDVKFGNILTYNEEGGDHPDFDIWQNLYEAICSEVVDFRKSNPTKNE